MRTNTALILTMISSLVIFGGFIAMMVWALLTLVQEAPTAEEVGAWSARIEKGYKEGNAD